MLVVEDRPYESHRSLYSEHYIVPLRVFTGESAVDCILDVLFTIPQYSLLGQSVSSQKTTGQDNRDDNRERNRDNSENNRHNNAGNKEQTTGTREQTTRTRAGAHIASLWMVTEAVHGSL